MQMRTSPILSVRATERRRDRWLATLLWMGLFAVLVLISR